ncbi:PREDICTED: endocuticle structural glycoprotein ABD-5-like [Nicrophorus vespilloides]|uniref:Endocuticle structural glycoprotein ABD-5-like n=1 Tax=Nicrophorus vespilloides TaxID=110193 RepID=A0ABM1NG23_NICVS|nr:PREDICTED: endocuticle structural glycoprotein ABD-5-like [Nicrophorus vespilloides]
MKVVILLFALFAIASARPNPQIIPKIINYVSESIGLGGYRYAFETDDGTKKEEVAEIVNEGRDDESLKVKGSYSYVGDDGQTYTVEYIADENGFQPKGEHIPASAGVQKPQLGVPSAALASLAGGGIGK